MPDERPADPRGGGDPVKSRDESEKALEATVQEETKSFLQRVLEAVALAIAQGRVRDVQPTLALGTLLGWWTDAVGDKVVDAVRESWQAAFTVTLAGRPQVDPRADAMAFHIAAVKDRLSRSALPEIPEQAFDQVRLSQSAAALNGKGHEWLARDIAERLAWEPNKDYWREQKADAEAAIDAILNPLGKPGTPARTHAHKHDPQVKFWQGIRAEAVDKIREDEGDWKVRATRIARTESTSAWNSGALAALAAEGRTHKRWVAAVGRRDPQRRTRDSHREAHGQVVPISRPFRVGKSLLMMPGDPGAPPHEVINCRCTVVGADEPATLTSSAALRVARLARKMGVAFAVLNQSWPDQLRIPRGNGERSGRWTYTPWMHLDDLLASLDGLELDDPKDSAAYHTALPFLQDAEDALGKVDRDNFNVRDPAVADAAREASQALDRAAEALDGSLASFGSQIEEARDAIGEFADVDWSLMDEATDIGRSDTTSGADGAGRRSSPTLWVWTDPLPSDAHVNPAMKGRTSKELADRLAEIKGHHTAPSPKMRRDRAEAMQELNDRRLRDQDPLAVDREEEETDITREEETDVTREDKPFSNDTPVPADVAAILDKWVQLQGSQTLTPDERKRLREAVEQHGEQPPGRLYRGASLPAAVVKSLTDGQEVEFGPSSTSAEEGSALPYAENGTGEVPVLFNFMGTGLTGLDVSQRAEAAGYGEAEWVTGGRFFVRKIEERDGVLHVNLTKTYPGHSPQGDPLDMDSLLGYEPAAPEVDPNRHRHQDFIDEAKAGDAEFEVYKNGVKQPGGPWKVSHGTRNGYIRVVNSQDVGVDVNREDLQPAGERAFPLQARGTRHVTDGDPITGADIKVGDVLNSPSWGDLAVAEVNELKGRRSTVSGQGTGPGAVEVIGVDSDGHVRRMEIQSRMARYRRLATGQAATLPEREFVNQKPEFVEVGDRLWTPSGDAVVVGVSRNEGDTGQQTDFYLDYLDGDLRPTHLRYRNNANVVVSGKGAEYDPVVKQIFDEAVVQHGPVSDEEYLSDVVNAIATEVRKNGRESVEVPVADDPPTVELPQAFQNAYKELAEAVKDGDRVAQADSLRRLYIMARTERSGPDPMPDAAFEAMTDVFSSIKDYGYENWDPEVVAAFKEALQGEGVPDRWRALASLLPTLDKPDPDSKAEKDLRESEAAHKAYRDALRAVDVSDGVAARQDIKRLLANLRGQTVEDLHLGILDEDNTEWVDHYLSMMQDAIAKPSRDQYDEALANLQRRVSQFGDGNPWRGTVWTLRDLNQSAWRPTDIWNPPPDPKVNAILNEILETPNLGHIGVAIGMEDLWRMSEQEDQDYINKGVGYEKFWVTKRLQEAATAMRGEDHTAWDLAMTGLLMQTRGMNNHWGQAEQRLERVHALGKRLLHDRAGKVEQELKAKYGELPESNRSPESVIAHVGAFYATRTVNNNCVLASQAYEMRRRGLDVHPKRAQKGRNSTATQRAWYYTGYQFETIVEGLKGRRAKGRYETIVKHVKDHYDPGNRGTIRAGWKGRSFGHIWNWEVTPDGRVVFLDAQTGEVIDGAREDYWGEMDWRFVTLARLDHLTLKADIEVSFAPKENADKLTPELLAVAKQIQGASRRKNDLIRELNDVSERGHKVARQTSWSNPAYLELKEKSEKLRMDYYAALSVLTALKESPEGRRLAEVGDSFPFLDPNVYR
jgi:hypothetical protein